MPVVYKVAWFPLTSFLADAILSSSYPLKGVAIGNGWIDAKRQYPSYLSYAVKHGLIEVNSEVSPFLANWLCAQCSSSY